MSWVARSTVPSVGFMSTSPRGGAIPAADPRLIAERLRWRPTFILARVLVLRFGVGAAAAMLGTVGIAIYAIRPSGCPDDR